jgi:glycolate oxidase iron-sulfur subunit
LAKLALRLIENKRWRTRIMPFLSVYLKSGLQQPLRKSGLLKQIGLTDAEALLTEPTLQSLAGRYPTRVARRGCVALFTGCIAEAFDRDTLMAGIALLNHIGYEVWVPEQQGCCGAIHLHNGQSASGLIEHNMAVFNALAVDAVLHAASGCGAMLSEYQSDDHNAAADFRGRLVDINDFLLANWPDDLSLLRSDSTVAVHEPCSQRHVLKNAPTVYALLAKIPGLNLVPLAENPVCCGAGGSYMLTHPENAGQLRELTCQALEVLKPDRVVSSNYGCAVFLTTNTRKVVHPLSLLARQLPVSVGRN